MPNEIQLQRQSKGKSRNMKLSKTIYADDFIEYYIRAAQLQRHSRHGMEYDCPIDGTYTVHYPEKPRLGCDLQENVPIYDTIHRRYAGFGKVIRDFKGKQKDRFIPRKAHDIYADHYLFMLHRITGSGASFEEDHGYRNSIVLDVHHHCETIEDMVQYMEHWRLQPTPRPIFTSIGNQIPLFPKPSLGYSRGSELYICKYMPQLVVDYVGWLLDGERKSIREATDFCLDWNKNRGIKQFHFAYTAFVMDTADYFPELVNPWSMPYYGKNAIESLSLQYGGLAGKLPGGIAAYDRAFDTIMHDIGRRIYPMDLEDVLCDYVRYVEGYIPRYYLDKFGPLRSASIVPHHPKRIQY